MIEDGGILYSQIDSQLPGFVSTDHTKFSKFIEKYYEFLELNLITFTDLNLNEDAILQEKANTSYTITVATGNNAYSNSADKFYVDGAVSPTITLTSGSYVIFDQGDETNDGHYFHISKTPNGIHTAGGVQFTTDDRDDVLFTFEGTPADYDNITLQDNTGILLYEDMRFAAGDADIVLDNITLEDEIGILLYNEIILTGGYIAFEQGHYVLDELEGLFIQSEDFTADETGTVGVGYQITVGVDIGLEASATIQFYVSPDLAGETLYYYCNNHSGMGGNITVSTATTWISQENGNTDSANTSTTDYIAIESPSRQGDQFLSGEIILGANSGATGIIKGKYSTTQAYVEETNNGAFQVGETIAGKTSRATATINSYSRQPINASRNVKSFQDIDKAPAGFVELFRKEFLTGFTKNADVSTSNLLKNIKDFYRSKGNENSFRYIFRLLFGIEDVEFYYPGKDMLRLSDGRWTLDKSVKILTDSASYVDSFLGRTLVGETSNVSALVERVERYHVGAQDITELFLSGFDANNSSYQATAGTGYTTFYLGETVTANSADDDGNYATAITSGVLQGVDIVYGGSGYTTGDELIISGGGGAEAKAKVGSVATSALTGIDVIDSGDGYSVGDTVVFVNEGTGGTGGAARVDSIVKTITIFQQTETVSQFQSDTLDASAFTAPWGSYNRNTHSSSNSTTTFTVPFDGLSGVTPKQGDFIAEFGSGESITLYTPGTSKFGTVISTNSTSITYGLGSIDYTTTYNADPTLNNFADDDAITIFDLSLDEDGAAISSNGHNSTFRVTGASFNINGTPAANTDTTYHGAATMTATDIGGVRSVVISSSGQGYLSIPPISVANTQTSSYGVTVEKLGANSIFVNLANTIANTFTANTLIKNSTNNAFGFVLDYIDFDTADSPATLVDSGNTTLRIQMTSANTFSPNDILTSYSRADSSPTGTGDFGTANISTSGTTATFTQPAHGFGAGERIVITGSESATDNTVYNNNHTIGSITDANTFVVTFPSSPTDTSETSLTVRKIVTANVAYERILSEDSTTTQLSFENGVGTANDDYSSSTSNGFVIVESGIDEANATFANTGFPGNNAVITVAALSVGAIESVLVYNFGAGYAEAPTISAAAVGDGSATLTGNVGVYAEYAGYFDGNYGLLSGTNKMQDNLYYQDFSYVVKTNTDVETYRDKILELVHPAGMALFGEILLTANLSVTLFDNATRNISTTQANTAQVANTVNVPLYNHHEIEFYTSNTASTNNQVLTAQTYLLQTSTEGILSGLADAKMDTTGGSTDFDLQLEHGNDLFSLESSGYFLAFENTGELLLEIDISGGVGDRLIEETADFLLTEAEIIHILLEEDSNDTETDILLLDDGTTTNDNASIIGALSDENQSDSSPIIYEFFEAHLGRVITEDEDDILVDVLSHDTLHIDESTGDFITTEDEEFIVEEDEAGQFSQGFKLQQEGTFLYVATEGNLSQEDGCFTVLEQEKNAESSRQLGLESGTVGAQGKLNGTVYVELEQAIGGDSTIRTDLISHFVFEDDDTDTVQIRNEDESSNFKLEDFESALELETNTDGIQEGRDASIPSFLTFKDDAADGRAYLLEEPTTIYHPIESENPADHFVIVTDDAEDTIVLEIEEFITDTTIKGESYESGTGFTLPMLLFPLAESGSALLDLSFTSRIVIEIDDIQNVRLEDQDGSLHYEDDCTILYEQQETTSVGYQYDFILLEESDDTNPVYIATESSMTEEVDTLREIDIMPDGNYQLILEDVHGIHINGFLIHETGVEDKINLVQPHVAASVRATHALTATGDTLNEGSFLTTGIGNRKYGSVAISDLTSEFELLTENGRGLLSEQSTTRKDNFITEDYERGVVVTGTATQFEFDFNNLIVLEAETGVVEMEIGTPEENSIIQETNDPDVFELIQLEGASISLEDNTGGVGNIITEDDFFIVQEHGANGSLETEEDIHQLIPAPARLCNVGLHDLILEEEGILQEESDQIKLEDFTFDNITQEDVIMGDFVPYLGFGDESDNSITIDDNMLLESTTHKTENVSIVNETGDLIGQEEDETSHIVLDDFYFKYYSKGTITQIGTTITLSGSTFPSSVVNGGRFYYQNGEDSTVIVSLSASGLELIVEDSKTISSAEHYKVEYGLDDTPATAPEEFLVMEAYTLDTTVEQVRIDIIFNGAGDVSHGYTRGEDSDGNGTYTVSIAAFADIVGNDITFEDGERMLTEDSIGGYVAFEDSTQNVSLGIAHSRVLNEDDTGCFISSEDHEGNETSQDDNVLMKEMSDALLLEDSETETLNYVLSEEAGQMMLEEVFQVSEYKIVLDSSDSVLIEDQPDGDNWNDKLLNMDMGRFDIGVIANNTSLEIQTTDSSTSSADFFRRSDSAILVSRTEQIV